MEQVKDKIIEVREVEKSKKHAYWTVPVILKRGEILLKVVYTFDSARCANAAREYILGKSDKKVTPRFRPEIYLMEQNISRQK